MLLGNFSIFIRSFSSSTASLRWRNRIKQEQLVSQISAVLLQSRSWIPLLRKFNLSSQLTPDLFIQILRRTEKNAETSLGFFNWTKTNLGFQPDLESHCKIIQILVASGNLQPARSLLDSFIQSEPASVVLDSIAGTLKGTDCRSLVLSFVLEYYSNKSLVFEGLEVFRRIKLYGCLPSIRGCNAVLNALQRTDEIKLFWCFYSAIIRIGITPDQFTWSVLAQILCKERKIENIIRLLDSGIYSADIYNTVISCYSRNGNFTAAVKCLNEMYSKKLNPGFDTYSSILDGACKYGDIGINKMIMKDMVERKLLPSISSSDYDLTIEKLCDLGMTHAAEMFFERARDERLRLRDASYGCLLRALAKEGRAKEAVIFYRLILKQRISLSQNSYQALAALVCKEEPSDEVEKLLGDLIGRGFSPCASDLSKFIAAECNRARWREAERLLNVILEKGLLPDSFCCCSLVEHYCSERQIDLAIILHDNMERLGGSLDVTTSNMLLSGLFVEKRIEDAIRAFDYMRRKNVVNSESFSIMIKGLCHEKELRKAMKIHDEMLKIGLKPDKAEYKSLISGFL